MNSNFWWVVAIILSSISVSVYNAWMRDANLLTLNAFIISLPIIIWINYLYWIAYSMSPSFIISWVLSIVCCGVCVFFIEYVYFKEIILNMYNISGIILIIFGLILMRIQ